MTITALFSPLNHSSALIIPRPTVTMPQSVGAVSSSAKITISNEARSALALDKQKILAGEAKGADELRSLLSQYDFNNITPRQMADLGGTLLMRGEISQDVACCFIGIEKNLVVELDEIKPINLNEHFDFMLSVVADAARKESGWEFGLSYRQNASKALNDIQSFVQSNRLHLAT